MTARTPDLAGEDALAPLASRYVKVADLPWQRTAYDGIEMKVLMEDEQRGLKTVLMRWAPGAELPSHEHVDIEQTYVIEGRLEDDEGAAGPGAFVWRPAGSRHAARAPEGALILAVFLKPNRFEGGEGL